MTAVIAVEVDLAAALDLLDELSGLMGELACLTETDASTAAELLRLRDDLSAHVRAAAVLDGAGLPQRVALDMLQRGATVALSGLAALAR